MINKIYKKDRFLHYLFLYRLGNLYLRTAGIKMLYVFVDIKIDSLHFVETLKHNFLDKEDFPEQPRLALFR